VIWLGCDSIQQQRGDDVQKDSSYYPIIILGATFAGLGAAYSHKQESLIIERSALVGYEFINSYNPGEGWNEVVLSTEGGRLKKELLERQILSEDGRAHIPAVAPVLYNKIAQDSLNILLHTEIADISQAGDVIEVTIYNASGLSKLKTDLIVDTRPDRARRIKSKSINAMLSCGEEEINLPDLEQGQAQFVKGKLKGEIIVKVPVDVQDSWTSARHKLHQLWVNRPPEWASWTLAAIAGCFDIQAEHEPAANDPNCLYLPSSAYRNPLEAFEAGIALERGN
jgi:hypothetical protein